MADKLLRFEDGKISIGGKALVAKSANLSISTSLDTERVYGDLDLSIVGARTEFIKLNPNSNLKGELDISFYISSDTFLDNGNINSIDRMFEIVDGMSESAIDNNIVGRYSFDNMYLKSFGFQMSPFRVIEASAKYDIYGSISRVAESRFHKSDANFAHSLKSFGVILANYGNEGEFEISNMNYDIQVTRKTANRIRASENTAVGTNPGGVLPFRVNVEEIAKKMTVSSNEMIDNINSYGDRQNLSSAEGIGSSSMSAFLLSMSGERIAKFTVNGKLETQSMNISEGKYATSSITIKEIVK